MSATLEANADAIRAALDAGESINSVAKQYGVARSTLQAFARDLGDMPTREDIDDAHARAVQNGDATAEDVAQIPGQQDLNGGEVRQKDGGEILQSFPEEIRVDGTTQLAVFDLGGKRAQSSSLRLSGGKVLLLDGKAFRKGEVIEGTFTAVVREVGQRDKPDPATGIVVSAEQKHVAQIVDLTVKPAE